MPRDEACRAPWGGWLGGRHGQSRPHDPQLSLFPSSLGLLSQRKVCCRVVLCGVARGVKPVRNGHLPFMETVPVLYVHIARDPPCLLGLWLCRRQLRVPESNSVLVPSEG